MRYWHEIGTGLVLCSLTQRSDARAHPRENCGVKHVHLAVGRDARTCMTVSFASSGSSPNNSSDPIGYVALGSTPFTLNDLFYEDISSPVRYNLTEPSSSGSMYYSPFLHHVEICGLQPNTRYFYQPRIKVTREKGQRIEESIGPEIGINNQEEEEESDFGHRLLLNEPPYRPDKACPSPTKVRHFRTAPREGDFPVKMALIGDLGQFSHSVNTLKRLMEDRVQLNALVIAGDVGYANGHHQAWDTFFDFLDDYDIAAHVPLQICPGNHDVDRSKSYNNIEEIFQAYELRFDMPQVQPAKRGLYSGIIDWNHYHYPLPYDYGNAFYGWAYGGVHNIMLNSYSAMEPGTPQYQWLVKEMENIDRDITPWVIVTIHVPIYNTFKEHRHDPQVFAAREHLEPLFIEHLVNLVVTGHVHAYQRTHPVVLGERNQTGPVHVTVGSAGRQCKAEFHDEEFDWMAEASASSYGYGMLTVLNASHAEWNWIHTGHSEANLPSTQSQEPFVDRVMLKNQFLLK